MSAGLGIDFGASALKVVELARRWGGWRLTGVARRRIGMDGDPLAAARGWLPSRRRGIPVVAGISGRDVHMQMQMMVRTATQSYGELLEMELAHRREGNPDVYVDAATLRRPDAYNTTYATMFVAARREATERRLALVREAGLDAVNIVPNGFALAAAYRLSRPRDEGTVLLLDIGAAGMEFVLVRDGRLLFARNLTVGARLFDESLRADGDRTLAEAEALKIRHGTLSAEGSTMGQELQPQLRTAAGQIKGIVESTINFARTQLQERDLTVQKIRLSGGGARIGGLREYLESATGVEVAWLELFGAVDGARLRGAPEGWDTLPTDMACALGLAAIAADETAAPAVAAVPRDLAQRRERRRLRPLFGGIVAAAILLAAAVGAAVAHRVRASAAFQQLDDWVSDAERRVTRLEEAVEELEAIRGIVGGEAEAPGRAVRAYVEPGRVLLESIARLQLQLPEGLSLTGVAIRESGGAVGGADPAERVVVLQGEVYVRAESDPLEQLEEILSDSARRLRAKVRSQSAIPDKPGWRRFEVVVQQEAAP